MVVSDPAILGVEEMDQKRQCGKSGIILLLCAVVGLMACSLGVKRTKPLTSNVGIGKEIEVLSSLKSFTNSNCKWL
jgi:uncharacterized membrane protein